MYLLKTYIQYVSFVVILSIISLDQSIAADEICDIVIEGATVNMSRDEFITVMTANGLYDGNIHKQSARSPNHYKYNHRFSSAPPGAQQAPGDYTVSWSRNSDGFTISATYYKSDRGAKIFQERINTICPNNKQVKSTELTCTGRTPNSISLISKYPKDQTNFPYCYYGAGFQGPNVTESVHLRLQNSIKVKEVTKKGGKKTFIKGR